MDYYDEKMGRIMPNISGLSLIIPISKKVGATG